MLVLDEVWRCTEIVLSDCLIILFALFLFILWWLYVILAILVLMLYNNWFKMPYNPDISTKTATTTTKTS